MITGPRVAGTEILWMPRVYNHYPLQDVNSKDLAVWLFGERKRPNEGRKTPRLQV